MLGQHRQACQVQRQGAAVGLLEVEAHAVGAFDSHPSDIGELGAVFEAAFAHQQLKGETHVFGAHRFAVGEGGAWVDFET
ncbi:hypothetical protein D3C81_1834970 [compost metagenome]